MHTRLPSSGHLAGRRDPVPRAGPSGQNPEGSDRSWAGEKGPQPRIEPGIFALRQRRTDPAWFGRAFAVSLSLNFAGVPIGSALSGPLLEQSIALPLLLGAAVTAVAAVAALLLIPARAAAG